MNKDTPYKSQLPREFNNAVVWNINLSSTVFEKKKLSKD
jgi:hypothetical protein